MIKIYNCLLKQFTAQEDAYLKTASLNNDLIACNVTYGDVYPQR